MFKSLTNEQFLQKLKNMSIKYTPLEKYKGSTTKIKWACYKNPKHVFEATPDSMYRCVRNNGCICPYCDRRLVFVGETDMWTTNPELAHMLENLDDGYKYLATSSKRVNFVCPKCGSVIKDKIINNVRMFGLSCGNCSDGMSFCEKFVYELLLQLNCEFIHDRTICWSEGKRYDFYIPKLNMIIETHGLQHYEDSFTRYSGRDARTAEEERQNDKYKKDLALFNGIEHYIQLDCKVSDCDYIKNSIENSKLVELFDLSVVDWDKCLQATFNSNVVLCANLWNDGMKSTRDIANFTGIDISSVIPYLKKAAKIGLCDYVKNYNQNKSKYKKILCVETNKIYECIKDAESDGYNKSYISKCLHHKDGIAYGLHWRFV